MKTNKRRDQKTVPGYYTKGNQDFPQPKIPAQESNYKEKMGPNEDPNGPSRKGRRKCRRRTRKQHPNTSHHRKCYDDNENKQRGINTVTTNSWGKSTTEYNTLYNSTQIQAKLKHTEQSSSLLRVMATKLCKSKAKDPNHDKKKDTD
jgi:hypothetical protein